MPNPTSLWQREKVWWVSVGSGALLGCIFRLLFSRQRSDTAQVVSWFMTLGFLIVVPFVMGYIAVKSYLQESSPEGVVWYEWLFLPWATVILSLAIALAIKWEGFICVISHHPSCSSPRSQEV